MVTQNLDFQDSHSEASSYSEDSFVNLAEYQDNISRKRGLGHIWEDTSVGC